MKKFTSWTVALMIALLTIGCSKDKASDVISPSPEQREELPKHTVSINISGTFNATEDNELKAYLTPTNDKAIKITFDDSELMKDGTGLDANGKPKREMNTKTAKLTLYFVEKSNLTNVSTAVVNPTDFRKNDDDTYTIAYSGPVTLSGADFTTGEWYISGGYRLQKDENTGGFSGAFTYVNADGKIEGHDINGANTYTDFKLPFVFGWTKLTTRVSSPGMAPDHAENFSLKLIPDGYYIRFRAINNLVEDIKLRSVVLHSTGMSVFANHTTAFDYKLPTPTLDDLTNSKTPRVDATVGNRFNIYGLGPTRTNWVHGYGPGLLLSAGEYYTNYQRFTNPDDLNSDTGVLRFSFSSSFIPQGEYANGTALDSRETTDMPVPSLGLAGGDSNSPRQATGYITDLWRGSSKTDYTGWNGGANMTVIGYRGQIIPAGIKFKRGHVKNLNYKVTSDLMITELYTRKFSGKSYGLIEIYNPTLDPIDVSKYALMRFGYHESAGAYKAYQVPFSTSLEYGREIKGLDITNSMHEGLLLPLDMKSGTPSGDWAINSFNRYVHQATADQTLTEKHAGYPYSTLIQYTKDGNVSLAATGRVHSGFDTQVVDFADKNYITGLKSVGSGKTILQPGKTMIILFSGYTASDFSPTAEDRAIFAQIQSAVTAGYCEYVVALAHGDITALPHTAKAGVTTADIGDGFSLVRAITPYESGKFDTHDFSRKRVQTRVVVDGTWNSYTFDGGDKVKALITGGAQALIRRPYGPYLWNTGFQDPSNADRYYQKAYTGTGQTTFGAPYFTSYEAGKTWSAVVQPRINKRDAALFK